MKRAERALAAAGVLALFACREPDTTADGIPIAPLDRDAVPSQIWESRDAHLRFDLELWTNRMPGPATPRHDSSGGFRIHAALRVEMEYRPGSTGSIRIPALTLWSPGGDTMIAAFALTRPDGGAPMLASDPGDSAWELTDDRDRPRFTDAPPDAPCTPVLMVEGGERRYFLRLPDARIAAVY